MKAATIEEKELHLRVDVSIAGVRWNLHTNSEALARIFRRYANLPFSADGSDGLMLRVLVSNDHSVRSPQAHFRGLHHIVLANFSPCDRFVFDLRRKLVSAKVSASLAPDAEFWTSVFIPICTGVMGPTVGLAPIHSACLEFNGEGVLIAGISGAGKSTLTVALAKAGLSLLSDDWTYVGQHDSELIAFGLGVPVKLLPDAVDHFPELNLAHVRTSMNGELAYEVDAAQMLKVKVGALCCPRRLVFVERGSINDFRRLSQEFADKYFTASAERLPEQLADVIQSRQQILTTLSALPCYQFRYNGTPQDGAAALIDYLRGI